jgi:DNA-directed RNA polymerase specialized sigma subunit
MPSAIEAEYEPHYRRWKEEGTPEAKGELLRRLAPVLNAAIRTYAGDASPAIQGRAKLLALEAVGRYDPKRGPLRSHLMSHLRGLYRHAARQSQVIKLPERAALALGKLKAAENELEDSLGRPPSTAELADHTGLSPERIARVRLARPGLTEGQTTIETDEGESAISPAVRSRAGIEAWQNFVYHDLHPHDQLIMEHSLGLHGAPVLPKNRIAGKLGISPAAVTQRAKKIQDRLDSPGGEELF